MASLKLIPRFIPKPRTRSFPTYRSKYWLVLWLGASKLAMSGFAVGFSLKPQHNSYQSSVQFFHGRGKKKKTPRKKSNAYFGWLGHSAPVGRCCCFIHEFLGAFPPTSRQQCCRGGFGESSGQTSNKSLDPAVDGWELNFAPRNENMGMKPDGLFRDMVCSGI